MGPKRRLVYRFLELPHVWRRQVLVDLGLLAEGEPLVEEGYAAYFRRAGEEGILDRFWAAVEQKHGGEPPGDNPFSNGASKAKSTGAP